VACGSGGWDGVLALKFIHKETDMTKHEDTGTSVGECFLRPLKIASIVLLAIAPLSPGWADEYPTKACIAEIKAKNTSPNHKIKIDKLSTAKGPVYVYGARSPSKPHRVLDKTGEFETWNVELDTTWVDSSGYGCDAIHRVKVDLVRDGKRCEDIKFPYSGGTPSNPNDSFVNKNKGGATFNIGDLQKAFNDCLNDPKCDCD
jgi:hypothetical protein